jgi:hypothetical protein
MALIYHDDEGKRSGAPMNVHAMNPHKPYSTHLKNWFYLQFILLKSESFVEKRQAQRELSIAERKLSFWYRHPRFEVARAATLTKEAQAEWKLDIVPKHK